METKKSLFIQALKAGFIIWAAVILLFFIEYIFGIKPVGIIKPMLLGLISLAVYIVMLIIMVKSYRKSCGGALSFGDAFLFSLIAMVFAGILSTLFNYLFQGFFDPNYYAGIIEDNKTWFENFLTNKNASPEDIEQTLDKFDKQAAIPLFKRTIKEFLTGLGIALVASLIMGAALKRKPETPFNEVPSNDKREIN